MVAALPAAIGAPVDPELAHARAERVRVDAELGGDAERSIDAPVAFRERELDVSPDHVVERLDVVARCERGSRGVGVIDRAARFRRDAERAGDVDLAALAEE